jgi:MFS transporter, DHA1 family, multidrug resistance protein
MELWKKNLYTIWIAQFITIMGMSSVTPFLPFYVRELGISDPESVTRWSGLVFAGPFFLSIIFTPLWGAVGDRYGRKLMVVRAVFGLGIAQILVGTAQSVDQLLLFRMIQGALSGFIPAALALVSASAPRERAGYAMGILQTSLSAGILIGPMIGGLLADIIGYRPIFFVVATLCFISGIFVMTMVNEKKSTEEITERFSLLDNYRYSFSHSQILIAMLLIFLAQSSISIIQPVFALFVESISGPSTYISTITGLLFAVVGFVMVFSSPWWGTKNDTEGYRRNLLMAFILTAIMLLFQALSAASWQVALSRAGLGFAMGGVLPTLYSFISKQTPIARKGGIIGIASSFTILANITGPISSGYIASHFGLRSSFFITAAVAAFASILVFKYITEPENPETGVASAANKPAA